MNKIKVIKKRELNEQNHVFQLIEGKLLPKSKQREAIETVENWITDWRKLSEIKTRLAFDQLRRLQL